MAQGRLEGINYSEEEEKEKECVDYLIKKGYALLKPMNTLLDINTPSSLVKFFYYNLILYSPDAAMTQCGDKKRDLNIAKRFVKSKMDLGLSKKRAYQECAEFIQFMLKFENRLNLSFKISSMRVLSLEKMKWFLDVVVESYNGYNKEVEAAKENVWFDNLYSSQELDITDEQLERTNKMLGLK